MEFPEAGHPVIFIGSFYMVQLNLVPKLEIMRVAQSRTKRAKSMTLCMTKMNGNGDFNYYIIKNTTTSGMVKL
jgi:hypothetical protein